MFFNMGGFPGINPQSTASRVPVNNTELYKVLEVDKGSTPDQIKRQYRKLAKDHHPDKGGDPERFKRISHAYDVLSNEEKRKIYDAEGEEGLEAGGGGGDQSDFLDMFFGGGGGRSKEHRQKRGEDIQSELSCSLETLYRGGIRKMQINKDVLCPDCGGHGGPVEAFKQCTDCNGMGIRVKVQQVGPMIMQQSRTQCATCRGEGKSIAAHLKCNPCSGGGTVKEKKVLEVYINPGAPNDKKITFAGESDQKPGETAGDVVFVIKELPHDLYKRKGTNLYLTKEVTLYEALTGCKFVLKHLDDRKLVISSKPGDIINPRSIKCVENEGMPHPKNRSQRGHLFIDFVVKFPTADQLDDRRREGLKKVLPLPTPIPRFDENAIDVDFYFLEDYDLSKVKAAAAQEHREAYEEDDERPHGEHVQCRSQ